MCKYFCRHSLPTYAYMGMGQRNVEISPRKQATIVIFVSQTHCWMPSSFELSGGRHIFLSTIVWQNQTKISSSYILLFVPNFTFFWLESLSFWVHLRLMFSNKAGGLLLIIGVFHTSLLGQHDFSAKLAWKENRVKGRAPYKCTPSL